jgi:sulfide dehydrogenase cytochrome subunit
MVQPDAGQLLYDLAELCISPGDDMKRLNLFSVAAVLALAASSANASDVDALMENCNGCHGDGGVSQSSDVPTIAGFPEFVHVDALYIYQDEARPCAESEYRHGDTSRPATSMCAVAAELSEDDIDAVAAAYAEMPYVKATQEFDAALAATGEGLHKEHCDKCHSDAGTNPDDEAGMLGGQRMGYLRTSFEQYAAGTREQPGKMEEKLGALSAEDTEALVHYYGSIQ